MAERLPAAAGPPGRGGPSAPAAPARRADRALAWLVTGPLGRGTAFAIDFAIALRQMLASRRTGRG
jgi:hypothetical protein